MERPVGPFMFWPNRRECVGKEPDRAATKGEKQGPGRRTF